MAKSSRRRVLAVAAGGGVTAALAAAFAPRSAGAQGHDHEPVSGPLATATVTFGSWQTDPPTDRFTTPNPGNRNHHLIVPSDVTIKEGGTVNFIIGGFHLVIIYDDGVQPDQINSAAANPSFPLFIDDPNNRIYRGLNPTPLSQDRVEAVTFAKRGAYLVICGVRSHFVTDNMYSFVRVIP